jgi:hypothetical protein
MQIDRRVSNIIEATLAKSINECLGLGVSGKIVAGLAGKNFVKATEAPSSKLCKAAIRASAENHASALLVCCGRQAEHRLVDRKTFYVNFASISQACLEGCLAVSECQHSAQSCWQPAADPINKRFEQQVGAQQAAVEIDAEGNGTDGH